MSLWPAVSSSSSTGWDPEASLLSWFCQVFSHTNQRLYGPWTRLWDVPQSVPFNSGFQACSDSVWGWQMESLKMQELRFPKSTRKGMRKWLSQVKKRKSELFFSSPFKNFINVLDGLNDVWAQCWEWVPFTQFLGSKNNCFWTHPDENEGCLVKAVIKTFQTVTTQSLWDTGPWDHPDRTPWVGVWTLIPDLLFMGITCA